jgi:penicillin-binding protein 1A
VKFCRRGSITLAVIAVVVLLVVSVVCGLAYKHAVYDEPGEHISIENIRAVIAQESPVLYADGKTRIGVFFSEEHRTYVPYKEIPRSWVLAIIAAEDQRFWDHGGVDFVGISRAMWRNIVAGKMVAGGSSLTQQTAKNLYYRPDRSLSSKWTELLNAWRLEAHFSKQDILEFYANQFHVSSNGRGLGIAARYFFDKDVAELTTLECAFLAGLVKAPSRYNPFMSSDPAKREAAREHAQNRTRYVLRRMLDEGFLTPEVHRQLAAEPLSFKKGRFQYDTNVLLDEVESRLGQAPFPQLFENLGIDNPSTSGISIVTTVDESAQRGANYALWHHLTEVGPLIEGVGIKGWSLPDSTPVRFDPSRATGVGSFHRAHAVDDSGTELQLPNGRCVLDKQAIQRAAMVLEQSKAGNTWAKGSKAQRDEVLAMLRSGASVLVSVRSETDQGLICDLEIRTELQGAVMLLEQGKIRAMVGGNDNRNFNRAISARRQLGSTWKPVLYQAAFQLGWAPTDVVDNRNNVFHFEGTWYYPRADHVGEDWTSLSWLGTRSENLGSIWLLAHLTDRLGSNQFLRLAKSVGMTKGKGEDSRAFIRRVRDDNGVISTRARFPELAFYAARYELLGAMEKDSLEKRELRSLFYGRGIEAEEERIRRQGGKSLDRKVAALGRSYRGLAQAVTVCIPQVKALRNSIRKGTVEQGIDDFDPDGELEDLPSEPLTEPDWTLFSRLMIRGNGDSVQLGCDVPGEEWRAISMDDWQALVAGSFRLPDAATTQIGGSVSLGTLTRLHGIMERRLLVWSAAQLYDEEILQYHPDYRTLVGLKYMNTLATTFGVQEELPPVLSMPLGAVDLSLEEAASLYQGMMDGQKWVFPGKSKGVAVPTPDHPTQLIAEIRDRLGAVLYRAESIPEPQADPVPGRLVGDVLRNVVRWGTGRRARDAVTVDGVVVPVAGKTGTTNGYRNAAFAGFVPRYGPDGWRWTEGYTLVTYVGYDDNRSMRRKGVRLQGSNGALPVWIGTAQGLASAGLLGAPGADAEQEWVIEDSFRAVPVAQSTGIPLVEVPAQPERTSLVEGMWEANRRFVPIGVTGPQGSTRLLGVGNQADLPDPSVEPFQWDTFADPSASPAQDAEPVIGVSP